ncbi:CpsD/CapB family tyrosine-protein kinase [Thioclava sp. FR2]|uniref:CpsD/CapB family tyrosine-protein kinase n=1 Tax=Thioclava sp. FR2 TaxID=3445780 RepID=UPI003EB9177E
MARHNTMALVPREAPDMGFFSMQEDDPSTSRRDRSHNRSVFRTGQSTETDALPIDLEIGRDIFTDPFPIAVFNPSRVWESLNAVALDSQHLARNGLFTKTEQSAAGPAFDILRTRIAQAMADKGWRRLGITSPTHGCGKSFAAANLALALARRPGSRTVLIDLDLRSPGLHHLFGLSPLGPLREFLDGTQPMESLFVRIGRSLAIGLNSEPLMDAGDVLHAPDTADALAAMDIQLDPELVILDLPPTLVGDDVIAMADKMDAVLLVVDATKTTAKEIRACEALFEGKVPLLGVVLNQAQDHGLGKLRYGKT